MDSIRLEQYPDKWIVTKVQQHFKDANLSVPMMYSIKSEEDVDRYYTAMIFTYEEMIYIKETIGYL